MVCATGTVRRMLPLIGMLALPKHAKVIGCFIGRPIGGADNGTGGTRFIALRLIGLGAGQASKRPSGV